MIDAPFKDEIIYHWLFRLHLMSGNPSWRHTYEQYLKIKDFYNSLSDPININLLCTRFPKELGISSDTLLEKHTLLPLHYPFHEPLTVEHQKVKMKSGKHCDVPLNFIHHNTGTSWFTPKGCGDVKVCPECIKEAEIPYLDRNNLLPGNIVCYKHKCFLKSHHITDYNSLINFHEHTHYSEEFSVGKKAFEAMYQLSLNLHSVLNGELSALNQYDIKYRYISRLSELSYQRTEDIVSDFLDYYDGEFLSFYFGKEFNRKSIQNWLQNTLNYSTHYFMDDVYPLYHIILIKFFFGSIDKCKTYVSYNATLNYIG